MCIDFSIKVKNPTTEQRAKINWQLGGDSWSRPASPVFSVYLKFKLHKAFITTNLKEYLIYVKFI